MMIVLEWALWLLKSFERIYHAGLEEQHCCCFPMLSISLLGNLQILSCCLEEMLKVQIFLLMWRVEGSFLLHLVVILLAHLDLGSLLNLLKLLF